MQRRFLVILSVVLFVAGLPFLVEAKTKSLQEIEGDRVVTFKRDRKTTLPKKYIKRKAAKAYIGSQEDLKKRVTENLYTGENVIRHAKSDRYLNLSDAIVFNTGGGKIAYVERKDGAFTMIIDYPQGRKLDVLDEALFDEYANIINDDCTVPYVFFDKDGEEAAIVYFPPSSRVFQYLSTEGLIVIEAFERR